MGTGVWGSGDAYSSWFSRVLFTEGGRGRRELWSKQRIPMALLPAHGSGLSAFVWAHSNAAEAGASRNVCPR